MIEINIKVFEDGTRFVTDFTLPDGETVHKNELNQDEIGYEKLCDFEGHKAIMKYSDGSHRIGYIHNINKDEFYFTDDEELSLCALCENESQRGMSLCEECAERIQKACLG